VGQGAKATPTHHADTPRIDKENGGSKWRSPFDPPDLFFADLFFADLFFADRLIKRAIEIFKGPSLAPAVCLTANRGDVFLAFAF